MFLILLLLGMGMDFAFFMYCLEHCIWWGVLITICLGAILVGEVVHIIATLEGGDEGQ